MFKFFSDAFKEVGHVVWPTKKETRTYMWYNVVIIIFMTIFLSLAGFGFRSGLQAVKHTINPPYIPTEAELEANQQALESAEREKFGISNTEVTGIETTDANTSEETQEETTETNDTEVINTTEQTENLTLPSDETEVVPEPEIEATQNNQ